MSDPENPPEDSAYVLDGGRRLSESILWRLQQGFYDSQGAQAWSAGIVPHYITSNTWIADAYAKVVIGWLRDVTAPGSLPPLDLTQPLHILELGCGSGRFGFQFLQRLLDLLDRSSLYNVRVRYVMTDFTDSILEPLRRHPLIQPWIEQGVLDFARYDASAPLRGETGGIFLDRSGETLTAGSLRNPLVVIANYVFDGIPQDAFAARGGQLFELQPVIIVPGEEGEEEDLAEPTILQRMDVMWTEQPASDSYYGDPALDAILQEYAARLKDSTLLVPLAAIHCLRHLASLADGRLLLLSGDKGYCRPELTDGRGEPAVTVHGSFSMMVDYYALGRWFVHQGGEILASSHLRTSLSVAAGLLGTPPGGSIETRMAFDDAIEKRGPDDFFDLKGGFGQTWDDLTLEHLLAWVRLSSWDAGVLLDIWPALMKHVGSAAGIFRADTYRAVHEVWERYFPLHEARDLAFHLGVLLCEIDCFEDALPFFHESLAAYGPNAATVFNVGLCLYQMGHLKEALEQMDQALADAPEFEPAVELRRDIAAALKEARPRRRKVRKAP